MKNSRAADFRCSIAVAAIVGLAGHSVHGAVILDQIGSNPALFTGVNGYLSMRFTDPTYTTSTSALVDDFTVGSGVTINDVNAAVLGFGSTFKSLANVQGWEVAIYSTLKASNTSSTGNVYDAVFAPSAVTLTRHSVAMH